MALPHSKVEVGSLMATSTDGVLFNGNCQSKDRFYDFGWLDSLSEESGKLGIDLHGEICVHFAVWVIFMEVS